MQSSFRKVDDISPVVEQCVAIAQTKPSKNTISVSVKTLVGKVLILQAEPTDTIKTLKELIAPKENVRVDSQKLLIAGKVLDDSKTLEFYNIKEGKIIHLQSRNRADERDDDDSDEDSDGEKVEEEAKSGITIQINVTGGSAFKLEVEKGDTVQDIKRKIKNQEHIEAEQYKLLYEGKILDDNKTIEECKCFIKDAEFRLVGKQKAASNVVLTVYYQQASREIPVPPATSIKEVRQQIASNLRINSSFALVYDGKFLIDESSDLNSYGIKKNANVLVISEEVGGNCLKFMLAVEQAAMKGTVDLKESLNFLGNEQNLNEFYEQEATVKQSMNQYKKHPEEFLAIRLWTSNILYKQLHEAFANDKDLTPWGPYLRNFVQGLKYLDYYKGKAYLGVKKVQGIENYEPGAKINWKTISALSRSKEKAKEKSGIEGTLFEVEVISGRGISKFTLSPEEEVVLLPYTCFEVVDIKEGKPQVISLRELPIPRAPKVLFWVDDNPDYNYYHAQTLEENGISVVFCISTKDAFSAIENYKWLACPDNSNFRIVSDMVRLEEGGKPNYIAGIELLKGLSQDQKYKFKAIVFCNDLDRAKESAKEAKLELGTDFDITNDEDQLEKFINFYCTVM